MSILETEQYAVFRDFVFTAIVDKNTATKNKPSKRRSSGTKASKTSSLGQEASVVASDGSTALTSEASDLADFSEYIASEIFPNFPRELQELSYQSIQNDADVAEKWSLPLTLTAVEEVADTLPVSINDNLVTYKLIQPPQSDLNSFISGVLSSYVATVTVAPPKCIATKTTSCEICDREWVPLTYHHLVPKQVHAKVLKRRWHDESQLNSVAWLCRACHSFVHRMASNEELAKEWYTVEQICSRDDVQKWALWVGRVRWKKS